MEGKLILPGILVILSAPIMQCILNTSAQNSTLKVAETRLESQGSPPVQQGFQPIYRALHIPNPQQGRLNAGNLGGTIGTFGGSNGILIEQSATTNLTGASGHHLYFIVKNGGSEDEYVRIKVQDEMGYAEEVPPTQFYLASGASKEISVKMNYPPDATKGTPDKITINASGKRNTVKRSAYYYPGEYDNGYGYQPFCYDRYVTGNCRYRTDPYTCDQYKWTAYATIQSNAGIQQLRSIPEGLILPAEFYPGTRDRIRVSTSTSCCFPVVQFLSVHPYYPNIGTACVVDIRELQWLNPAEIAAVVAGVLILLVIIVVTTSMCVHRRRRARSVMVGQKVVHTVGEGTTR